jgi:hypothetical protein
MENVIKEEDMRLKAYPTVKDTPNRKVRKGDRARTFLHNKAVTRNLARHRKMLRELAADVVEEEVE